MSGHQEIVSRCADVLHDLKLPRRWMTARGLKRRLENAFTEAQIRDALIAESANSDRRIRYSYYPSRRTLDILWGHVEVVGEIRKQPDLFRQDGGAHDRTHPAPDDSRPSIFLSHNHRDAAKVYRLATDLNGTGLSSWMFQIGIEEGDLIAVAVKHAVEACHAFATYISSNSIGSLWVQKEFHNLVGSGRPTFIVVDGEDEALTTLVSTAAKTGFFEQEAVQSFALHRARCLGLSNPNAWVCRSKEFLLAIEPLLRDGECTFTFPDPPGAPPAGLGDTQALLAKAAHTV